MSYLVLARKSRPQTFDQVVGQRSIVKTLQNAIAKDRIAHALLFSGVRGVGKTTLARIMAKAINCRADSPADQHKPCNLCDSCKEISSGSSLDLYEIDGASNRGIQEIRELKERIRFLPSSSKYKIIIIDEVHMLTTEAFNALLKTLEEPPPHVYFMFATTEIHKIPITILSRCQQYELKRVPAKELYDHFARLAKEEGFEFEPAALSLIVREAGGSVRDGLSLLDQMFSFGERLISLNDTVELLGLVSRDVLNNLSIALLEGNRSAVFQILEEVFHFGTDTKRFLEELMMQFRALLLCTLDGCTELIDLPDEEVTELRKLAAKHSRENIHLKLSLLMQVTEDLRFSTQPRLTLETSFLKIIESGNVVPVSQLLAQLNSLETPEGSHAQTLVQATQTQKKTELDSKKKVSGPENEPVTTPRKDTPLTETPPIITKKELPAQVQTEPPKSDLSEVPSGPTEEKEIEPNDTVKDWSAFLKFLQDKCLWMGKSLQKAEDVNKSEGELQLSYGDPLDCSLLRQTENQKQLKKYLLDFFDQNLKVTFKLPEENEGKNDTTVTKQKKEHQLRSDPLVTMAADIFNGQVGRVILK